MKASFKTHLAVLGCVIGTLSAGCAKMNFAPVPEQDTTAVTPPTTTPSKTISTSEVVAYGNKQVDFLFVLDDSNSMLPELRKLAARMATFVSSLDASNIDWQMCLTTTRGVSSGGSLVYGTPYNWANYTPAGGAPAYILKKGTANLNTIFNSTIDVLTIGGGSSGDERAIKAAHDHFEAAGAHGCYRPGAAISVIVISDEDERSVGGVASRVKANDAAGVLLPMEASDLPANLVAKSKSVFGPDVRFTFSSIIVKPGDSACEAEQDKDTSPSHPGHFYEEASKLTDGGVGSICDSDYSANLNTFKDKIVNSLSNLNLECEPVPETLKVSIDGLNILNYKIEKSILKFTYALIEGTKIDLQYDCVEGIP
ncbi:hypothetical protein [Bdellovibrio bacteriovorus]|uniref:hypothetical protein n=1 Tax=Bdellovibrio bacteriovorus TaxID=959 RepID=UPI003D05245C